MACPDGGSPSQPLPPLLHRRFPRRSSATITKSAGTGADRITSEIVNPNYVVWYVRDQTVLSGFFATVTEEVLATIMGAATAREAWLILEGMFASRSRSRVIQIRA
jgi:hypothetical protein